MDDSKQSSNTQNIMIEKALMKDRSVLVFGDITPELSTVTVATLLALEAENDQKEIKVYVNTLGGDTYAGMAIYDTMRSLNSPISTICVGVAFSTGCLIMLGGDHGKRKAAKHARFMIHLGNSGYRGNTADIEISVNELVSYMDVYMNIYAERLNKSFDQVKRDMQRDYYMSAPEAMEYGLISAFLPYSEK